MKTTYLSSDTPLTKSFEIDKVTGELKKISHPRVIKVTSHEETCETIEELFEQLKAHADKGHSFLKGNVTRPLVEESRAGTTFAADPTSLLLLDLDGIKRIQDTSSFLERVGLADVDHIVQYSASTGVMPDCGLRAHIFMLLTKPWPPAMLKQWLIHLNLSVPELRSNIGMTRTGNALRWGLDVTTCQNDKLIYIAPPICGPGVEDSFKDKRIQLVKGSKRAADISGTIPTAEKNRVDQEKVLNELREKEGLLARPKTSFKAQHGVEYLVKPDQASVTGIKVERGFVYLNINGGDSWGYYHPENNPEFIYNFKGEPVYRTADLLPDYYAEKRHELDQPSIDPVSGRIYLACRNFNTAAYWNGWFEPGSNTLSFAPAKSKEQLIDFLVGHRQKVPLAIPDWTIHFDPSSTTVVDLDAKIINLFVPTVYMTMEHQKTTEVPPTIKKVISNAVGGSDEVFDHFMNTLACIAQYRMKCGTSWIFHGVQGTGKGIMLNHILKPIFGHRYVQPVRMRQIDSQFNGFMEECLILWVDEAKMPKSTNADVVKGDLKNFITEPTIQIRRMFSPNYEAKNYMNIIMVANEGDIAHISKDDRRFNVGVYQTKKLEGDFDAMLVEIEKELPAFASYLFTREADPARARRPLVNEARDLLIAEGQTSIEQAADALLKGDFQFFWDLRPEVTTEPSGMGMMRDQVSGAYLALMKQIADGKREVLVRDELRTLLEYTIGNMPAAPQKFTSFIKHHRLTLSVHHRDGKSVRGIKVNWKIDPSTKKEVK